MVAASSANGDLYGAFQLSLRLPPDPRHTSSYPISCGTGYSPYIDALQSYTMVPPSTPLRVSRADHLRASGGNSPDGIAKETRSIQLYPVSMGSLQRKKSENGDYR